MYGNKMSIKDPILFPLQVYNKGRDGGYVEVLCDIMTVRSFMPSSIDAWPFELLHTLCIKFLKQHIKDNFITNRTQ